KEFSLRGVERAQYRRATPRWSDRMSDDLSAAPRLVGVLDHLGLRRAHVAAMIPGDIAALASATPDRLAGVVLCTPIFLDPAPFAKLGDRVLLVSGEYGPTFDVTVHAADRLAGAERYVLDGYEAQTWSDVAADRTAELVDRMTGFLASFA